MEKKLKLGLDLGTNSVGFAVLDENNKLVKKNGKTLWGVRMFEEASDAKKRRLARGARARIRRRKERLNLLRGIFNEEINKVDSTFFDRLDDSFYKQEDKRHKNIYNLFTGSYNDKHFNDDYPTIFHLRKHLMESNEKEDIRLIFLVLSHMIKFRGNFIRPGEDTFDKNDNTIVSNTLNLFNDLQLELQDEFEDYADYLSMIEIDDEKLSKMQEIIISNERKKDKKDKLNTLFEVDSKTLASEMLFPLLIGSNVNFSNLKLVKDEKYDKCDIKLIVEDLESLIEEKRSIIGQLGKLFDFLPTLKQMADYYFLVKLLDDSSSLSDAMIKKYNTHKKELKELKGIIKKYLPEKYNECFKILKSKEKSKIVNYPSYIGMNLTEKTRTRTSHSARDDFYKYVKGLLDQIKDSEVEEKIGEIKLKIENNDYLLRINSEQNGAIPMQLNLTEMKEILDKQKEFYPFLNQKDETNLTNSEKIIKIFTFRIPYYVGHLTNSDPKAWVVRTNEKIYPWNLEEVVDLDKTAIAFIEKMQNKCTYLKGENDFCLPKKSIIFSEYNCLSYLNKISLNGSLIENELKREIFDNVFLIDKNPTKAKIYDYIKNNHSNAIIASSKAKDLPDLNCNMESYITFNSIFDGKVNDNLDLIESIIKDVVIFSDKKLLSRRLKDVYKLDSQKIKKILELNYSGYSSLSRRLIYEMPITKDPESGECYKNLLEAMWETNANLQEVLYNPSFRLIDRVLEYNQKNLVIEDYENITSFIEDNVSISPIMKRCMIQAYNIIEELEKILKRPIDEYYIEVSRGKGEKKKVTKSRYTKLKELYDAAKKEAKALNLNVNLDSLTKKLDENKDNLRRDAIYLYFSQLGKCMYSLENINFEEISQTCDIDHIYPQAIIKDDSLSNRVLVKKNKNQEKTDEFIFNKPNFLPTNAFKFYEFLKGRELISKEKFKRLTKKELKENELDGFVRRQLVSTDQSITGLISILKLYKKVNDKNIIYSKGLNVTLFRQKYDLFKSRSANNFHHAHDAYLNVIVGGELNRYYRAVSYRNVKDVERLKCYSKTINPEKILEYYTKNNPEILKEIKYNIFNRFDILETKKTGYVTSMFSKITLLPAKENSACVPVSTKDPRINVDKYGGITANSYTYYVIIKNTNKKGEVEYILEAIPTKDKNNIPKYLSSMGYDNYEIVHKNIRANVLVEYDDRRFYLTGRMGSQYCILNANDRFFNETCIKTIKKIEKFNKNIVLDNPNTPFEDGFIVIPIKEEDKSKETEKEREKRILRRIELLNLLEEIKKKFRSKKFKFPIFETIIEKISLFDVESLETKDIIKLVSELLNLGMTNQSNTADLTLINCPKSTGTLTINKKLQPGMKFIAESVTGYYNTVLFEVPM